MPVLVVYQSKYGSTRSYAEHIAKALQADVKPVASVKPEELSRYDKIAFGGYVYVGKIAGSEFLSKNQAVLAGKKLVVFSASGSPPGDASLQKAYADSVPEALRKNAVYVPLPGRIGRMDLVDTLLMLFPKAVSWLSWKLAGDVKAQKAYEGMVRTFDAVDFAKAQPIIDALR